MRDGQAGLGHPPWQGGGGREGSERPELENFPEISLALLKVVFQEFSPPLGIHS